MLRSRTAGALIIALAFLVAAPTTAGAWSGRSHWRFGSAHAWLFAPDPGLHTLPTGDGPDATLFDPDTRTLYVANYVSSTVSVLDPGGRTAASVPVGAGPVGLALNDRTLYVDEPGRPERLGDRRGALQRAHGVRLHSRRDRGRRRSGRRRGGRSAHRCDLRRASR